MSKTAKNPRRGQISRFRLLVLCSFSCCLNKFCFFVNVALISFVLYCYLPFLRVYFLYLKVVFDFKIRVNLSRVDFHNKVSQIKEVHPSPWEGASLSNWISRGCFLNVFFQPFLFLSFTYSIDVPGGLGCEICASRLHSQKCQPPFQTITVTPKDYKVTLNCSIETGGKVPGMTWQDLEKHLNASDAGLFLQVDSKNRSQPRECFSIKYASEYVLLLPCL